MEQREKDIQELCKQILEMPTTGFYNPNGADESTCPICHERVYYIDADMTDIKHNPNCGFLIAKDLTTNIIK